MVMGRPEVFSSLFLSLICSLSMMPGEARYHQGKKRLLGGTASAMVMGRPVVAASETDLSCSPPPDVRTSEYLRYLSENIILTI